MNVTIVGTGYVGLVTGACLADLGHHVFCLDADEAKVAMLNDGRMPIYEPGLDELVARNRDEGRLSFSTDVKASVAFGDLQIIAVGTPPRADGSADLRFVHAAAKAIGRHMDRFKVVVQKSTVPVGTAEQVSRIVRAELHARAKDLDFSVVSNPEFLKEGAAIDDFMNPDRIVLGVDDDLPGRRALGLMRQLYGPFNCNQERTRVMDVRSAELTKYAANAMLATRISFMNELANLADRLGADIELVRQGIGSDPRIGYSFLQAGAGYGGSCFPKDVDALCRTALERGQRLSVLEAVQSVNQRQKLVLLQKVLGHFGDDLAGREFAVYGLAFKPGTDDMREAPSRAIIAGLLRAGARVAAHDPVAQESAARALAQDLADEPELLQRLRYVERPAEALVGADALLLVTEWKQYRVLNPSQLKRAMRTPVVFDGRNLWDPDQLAAAGVTYLGVGRSNLAQMREANPTPQPAQQLALAKKKLRNGAVSSTRTPNAGDALPAVG
ncbi:UDP-glucose/GDP-mannose dehydrogenase family protein [Ramlibacter sp. AW1]|uniref:UDP-glucose 6-dehydrogenase n=1 Tax=Ramlibacter aurantiacus TaxID=2801330 RepID=A0A936ZSS3_9BURK|nr:UDP-glucose/GDP-mannose dehydrogenase family protein [Ramlibacter aurantiacus]MBL0419954.1 UDP-glucose/GDP-mannose dehydrogenase family protein [Ramlibacter aurantiacus]